MNEKSSTFYLFARPSFIGGVAHVLDLGANLQIYNKSKTADEADYIALLNDWIAVGDDIRMSINKYEQENKDKDIK
ncbi:hypothetical protein KKG85_01930 [Patescibacteria group bacterium]|nr:hypothetical protein [Patescibacteria group bacterium]MBU2579488.1 hypothetical protein [Patescibacteria group bacterium]